MLRLLLSRRTVLALIAVLTAAMGISFAIPQRFATEPVVIHTWNEAHPWLGRVARAAGLDHVFTSLWFALFLLLFLGAVGVSLKQQVKAARQRPYRVPPGTGPWQSLGCLLPEAVASARKAGFRKIAETAGTVRMVKHPAGYWGNVLLHAGFVLAIGSSLTVLCTQQRALLRIEEGETLSRPAPWSSEEHGIFAEPFELPGTLRLDALKTEFWETDDLKKLESELTLVRNDREVERVRIGINEARWFGSTRVFQTGQAGHNFRLLFEDKAGNHTEQAFSFLLPARRDLASYNDFQLDWIPFLVRGKYFADVEKRSMEGDPLLVLRLYEGNQLHGEVSLTSGTAGTLGPYRVTVVSTARWGALSFFDAWGMPGIFAAFAVISLGGLLHYFVVPREVLLRELAGHCEFRYEVARFREFYEEERASLVARLGGS